MASTINTSRLEGKTALITGSSRGMGRQNALELASRGADVVINYVHGADAAQKVVQEIQGLGRKAIAIQADMSQPAQIVSLFDQAITHFGKLDIVVSNSGVESFGHISEITPEEFDRVFCINTRGQLLVAQQAYKHLSIGGHLIMLSSISASAHTIKNHSIYSGSKGAVEAIVRCFATDMADRQIRVNAVAPGGIKTDMAAEAGRLYLPKEKQGMSEEELDKTVSASSPLNRWGFPEDVARVVAFLASDDSNWVTGSTIQIGGGAAM